MNTFKTLVFFSDTDRGKIFMVDTIVYKGEFWLVPEWIDKPELGVTMPARIICLDGLIHQETSADAPAEFVLNTGIPKSLFDGQIPPQSGDKYVLIERPDIRFPIQNDNQSSENPHAES